MSNFFTEKWNDMLMYEPVGCKVLVLTQEGTEYLAYRKDPTKSRLEVGTYFDVNTNQPIQSNIIKWKYP